MTPILFSEGSTAFTSNGIGRLVDAISCVVTEQRNGKYELELIYPVFGKMFSDISVSKIIVATPAYKKDREPFRIYKITKPMSGKIKVYAEHISYQLSHIPVMPFMAMNILEAVSNFEKNTAYTNPFTIVNHLSGTTGTCGTEVPISARALLGGSEKSFIKAYACELEFRGYNVHLWRNRGNDYGVQIRYGKNLISLEQEENIANTITSIVPYYHKDGENVLLPEKFVSNTKDSDYPFHRMIPVDLTEKFDQKPTEQQLRTAAEEYISSNNIGVPDVSLDVEFVHLAQTTEYKNIETLETVNLCDTVRVIFEKLGVNQTAKVIETQFDSLKEKYIKIKLGSLKSNLTKKLEDFQSAVINEAVEKSSDGVASVVDKAVENATGWITGANGGNIVINKNSSGQPYELLVLDTDSIETARKVWRWNLGGLGYSSTGYEGPYTAAITQDGSIVADFITAGTLQGINIIATLGSIGGWKIAEREIYQIVDDPDNANQKKKVSLRPPSATVNQWILSVQYSKDGGNTWYGSFYLDQNGAIYSRLQTSDSNIRVISDSGEIDISPNNILLRDKNNDYRSLLSQFSLQMSLPNKRVGLAPSNLSFFENGSVVASAQYSKDSVEFTDGAEYPAEMKTSGAWKYKKMGKNLYEIYGNVRHLGRDFSTQYGSVYYISEAAQLPSEIVTKEDVDAGKVYVYEMDVSTEVPSGTGIYYASIIDVSGVPKTNYARIHYYIASVAPQSNIDITAHIHMLFSVSD